MRKSKKKTEGQTTIRQNSKRTRVRQAVRIQPVKHKDRWMKGTILKKVSKRSYLVKAASGQVYRWNRKLLRQTKERPTQSNMAGEDCAEDELVIPFTEQQQMQDNEQSPANQNNHSENTITRFGRVQTT